MSITVNLGQVLERLVSEMWPGEFPLVVPADSLATGSSATSLLITGGPAGDLIDAAYSSGNVNAYDGVGVYIAPTNEGNPCAEGEFGGRVTRGGYQTDGTFTISPGFSMDPNVTDSGTADAAVTTTNTTLADTRESWAVNQWVGATVTATVSGKTMVVTSNTATVLTGAAGWSGGGNPGDTIAWTMTVPVIPKLLFFYNGLSPYDLLEAVRSVQRTVAVPRYLPMTLIPDGDMESETTGQWTNAVGTNTIEKSTSGSDVLTGQRALSLSLPNAGDAVQSGTVGVTEGEELLVSVVLKAWKTVIVSLRDHTNSAEIYAVRLDRPLGASAFSRSWSQVKFSVSVPSGCEAVNIRITAEDGPTTNVKVDHVILLQKDYEVWDWRVPDDDTQSTRNQRQDIVLEGIVRQREGMSFASDTYQVLDEMFEPWPWWTQLRDFQGVNSHRIQMERPCEDPLWLMFRAFEDPFDGISDDITNVSVIPIDILVAGAAAELLGRLAARARRPDEIARYRDRANRQQKVYRHYLDGIGLVKPVVHWQRANRVRVP